MSNLYSHIKGDKVKWVIVFIAIILLCAAVIGVSVKLNDTIKTKEVSSYNYAVGSLSTTTGKYTEDDTSIYTKNYMSVEDMKIEIKDDSEITYKVFFYTNAKAFVSCSSSALDADFVSSTIPTTAKYFRVVIYTTDDNLTSKDISGIAKNLTITINK